MSEEQFKPLIELDKYLITFMPDYTGFLYIEADSGEIDIREIGKITFKDKLTKFYIEKNSSVIIHNPINLKSIKFEKFTTKEQEDIIDDNTFRSELLEGLKKKFENKK